MFDARTRIHRPSDSKPYGKFNQDSCACALHFDNVRSHDRGVLCKAQETGLGFGTEHATKRTKYRGKDATDESRFTGITLLPLRSVRPELHWTRPPQMRPYLRGSEKKKTQEGWYEVNPSTREFWLGSGVCIHIHIWENSMVEQSDCKDKRICTQNKRAAVAGEISSNGAQLSKGIVLLHGSLRTPGWERNRDPSVFACVKIRKETMQEN
ncbi:uncharacterized protein EI90DRAFT_1141378 [Cantharellus anzutake]|uniref:uncharacterized protein n=1 Tax=Cantharellus anzutake TaxID=1750568 RepID=UPI0019048EC6|nr:uncharacterized protein EI90DRAFT_1141378 [Cantharellus anzutake]KAF8330583.1 hypothetical protein EI90DRAFT_1141378 [Cantharellus anzutake]